MARKPIYEELAKDKPLVSIEDYMGKVESILVIDDVEEQRKVASQYLLEKIGLRVWPELNK